MPSSREPSIVRHPHGTFRQWLCGLFLHQDVNWSDGTQHYAYCHRCGKVFGNPWADPVQYLTPEQYAKVFPRGRDAK